MEPDMSNTNTAALTITELNIANVDKPPTKADMLRLIDLADTNAKELSALTGRSVSAINKYISGVNYDYLFFFALNYLVQQRLAKL